VEVIDFFTCTQITIHRHIKPYTDSTKTEQVENYRYLNSLQLKAVGDEELLYSAGYPPAAFGPVSTFIGPLLYII
jgi:hypothetical protein